MSGLPPYSGEMQDMAIDTAYSRDANIASGGLLTSEKTKGHYIDAHTTEVGVALGPQQGRYAFWEQPALMILCLTCGCVSAAGHHFYYRSLEGTTVSSTTTQQWAIRFGTAFAIFTQACFKATAVIACIQYGWRVIRAKVLTVKAIDKLFDLTVDPFSLFSIELFSNSVPLIVLAACVWLLPVAAVIPPGTLTVTVNYTNIPTPMHVPVINYESLLWKVQEPSDYTPTPLVLGLALQSAISGDIVPISAPGPNSSHSISFYGPSLNCSSAEDTWRQVIFDYFNTNLRTNQTEYGSDTALVSDVGNLWWKNLTRTGGGPPDLRMLAAFSDPSLPSDFSSGVTYGKRILNTENWAIDWGYLADIYSPKMGAMDIWLQLGQASTFCRTYNASYDITLSYENGQQVVTLDRIELLHEYNYYDHNNDNLGDGLVDGCTGAGWKTERCLELEQRWEAYQAIFAATANMVMGNVTMSPFGWLREQSSSLLLTKLVACPEFDLRLLRDEIFAIAEEKMLANETIDDYFTKNDQYNASVYFTETPEYNYTQTIAGADGWCRNGSIVAGIQDLMHNITISMMASPQLSKPSKDMVMVELKSPHVIYRYKPLNLLYAYAVSTMIGVAALLMGATAFASNGVSHSRTFSAIVGASSTREVNELFARNALATQSVDQELLRTRLRFSVTSANAYDDDQGVGTGFHIVRHGR